MTDFSITIARMSTKIPILEKIIDYLKSFLPVKIKRCTCAKFQIDAYLKAKL